MPPLFDKASGIVRREHSARAFSDQMESSDR